MWGFAVVWRLLPTYLSAFFSTVEQKTSMATSGTVTTTSVWHAWRTTTWSTRWRSAPPTRSCCCPPATTLPLRCGARHAWCVCHRPLPGRWSPACSCRPGWAATRTRCPPAVSMENHEPGWETVVVSGSWGGVGGGGKVWSFSSVVSIYLHTCAVWLQSVVLLELTVLWPAEVLGVFS